MVEEEFMSKTRKLGIHDHHQFESLECPQKEMKMPKEDGCGVIRCAESVYDAYIRPELMVVEQ
jgi:hypothetical protein